MKGIEKNDLFRKYETVLRRREDPIGECGYAIHGAERNENEALLG